MQSTRERLQQLVREVFGDDSIVITDATTAGDIDGWDSVRHLSVMFAIEEEFGVRFATDELAGFPDIGSLARHLEVLDGEDDDAGG